MAQVPGVTSAVAGRPFLNKGGTVLNTASGDGTNISNYATLVDHIDDSAVYGSQAATRSDDGNIYHQREGVTTARSGGTFAYFPNKTNRTATAPGFLIRLASSQINGIDDATLTIPGSDTVNRVAIHRSEIGREFGGVASGQAFDVLSVAGSALFPGRTKGSNAGATTVYGNDDASRPTLAIPGELVYWQNLVIASGNWFDYPAKNG